MSETTLNLVSTIVECTGVAVIHMLVTTEALEETASARPLPA